MPEGAQARRSQGRSGLDGLLKKDNSRDAQDWFALVFANDGLYFFLFPSPASTVVLWSGKYCHSVQTN